MIKPSYLFPSTAKPVLKCLGPETGLGSLVSEVETGVDRMFPMPLESIKNPNNTVKVAGSSVIGLIKPVYVLLQPPATVPKITPYQISAGRLVEATPQSKNVARELQESVLNASSQGEYLSVRNPSVIREKTAHPLRKEIGKPPTEGDALREDANVGSHITGTKYAKPCIVFTHNIKRNALLSSPLIARLPEDVRWILAGGTRPLISGNTATRDTVKKAAQIRSVFGSPYLPIRRGKINGSTKPPMEVPATMIPFARPLRRTNHSTMKDTQGE